MILKADISFWIFYPVICRSWHFNFSFLVISFLFLALLYWLKEPMKCIFEVVIMSIIVSFLKSEERFQCLIIRYHVSCRVFTNVLHQIEEDSFCSSSYGCIPKLIGKKKKRPLIMLVDSENQEFRQRAVREVYFCFTMCWSWKTWSWGSGIIWKRVPSHLMFDASSWLGASLLGFLHAVSP